MASPLPPFKAVSLDERRLMWNVQPNQEDLRRLLLEVERYRRLVGEIDHLYKVTHKAWRDTVGGDLVALNQLKVLISNERMRGA